jgi:MinD-like ATPase involved in chromosome partitioning or flagellar assembly
LPEEVNAQNLGFALVKHESGLQLLASPSLPQAEGFSAEKFNAAVYAMINFFTDIVVDCGPTLDAATRAAISLSDRILLPLAPEVTAVQTMTGTLGAMAQLQVPLDELRLVLNHPSPTPTLLPARIENALKRPLDATLPFDPGMSAALMQGAPLFVSQPNSPYMTALGNLIAKL